MWAHCALVLCVSLYIFNNTVDSRQACTSNSTCKTKCPTFGYKLGVCVNKKCNCHGKFSDLKLVINKRFRHNCTEDEFCKQFCKEGKKYHCYNEHCECFSKYVFKSIPVCDPIDCYWYCQHRPRKVARCIENQCVCRKN